MIGSLTGRIQFKTAQTIILDVSGVGYTVWVNLSTISQLGTTGSEASLITHLDVKEDSLTLYGFLEYAAYELFLKLVSVSGVGSKSALTILDLGKPEEIAYAIRTENVGVLTQVSGIGKKTAERIILELKEKVGFGEASELAPVEDSSDLQDALESLGYKPSQIQRVLSEIDSTKDLGDQVRQALKLLQS